LPANQKVKMAAMSNRRLATIVQVSARAPPLPCPCDATWSFVASARLNIDIIKSYESPTPY